MPIRVRKLKDPRRGACYSNVWQFMILNADGPHEWEMVQGIVTGRITIEGQRIGHCWAETEFNGTWYVYEPYFDRLIPRGTYYARAEPTCLHRYSLEATLVTSLRTGTVGAWSEDVAAALHTDDV